MTSHTDLSDPPGTRRASGASDPDGPIVRQFRQILMWPLQLVPQGEADDLPGDGGRAVERHWERLEQCGTPNPWVPLQDEFTTDPGDFCERHYRELVTFLPHVQRFLYGQGRSAEAGDGYGESPLRIVRRHDVGGCRITCDDGATLVLGVQHVDLYFFFDIDVVMLVLEIHAADLPLARVQDILYRFGRAFPAGWDPAGRPSACCRRVEWLDHAGAVLAASDFDARGEFLRHACTHRAARIGAHWRYLLHPMVPHESDEPGPVRYRQIEYHRMPKMSFLALDDPFALDDADFVRLALAGRPERGAELPYADDTVRRIADDTFYDRFWNRRQRDARASTRVTCNGHALTMVGTAGSPIFDDAETGLLGQFRHQYFLVAMIAHFHKAALLMLSDRLINAVSRLDPADPESQRRFRASIRSSREVFLRFNHRYWFHEVSNQSMAKDLYEMWSRHLRNDALFREVREEVLDMGQYLDSNDARRQGRSVHRLTVVTILGLVGTIVTGFLGMNLIDEAGQPLGVKIAMFFAVLVPTVALTIATVRYSRGLSSVLEALGDDSAAPGAERLARIRQVIVAGRARGASRPRN